MNNKGTQKKLFANPQSHRQSTIRKRQFNRQSAIGNLQSG